MNEKLFKKVFSTDRREKRDKTVQEIAAEWRDRRLIGVVFKWIGTLSALVFAYWYVFERSQRFTLARRLPVKARWSLGMAVVCLFLWMIYCYFGYRCPRCQRFHRVDWAPGAWVFGLREPPDKCRFCDAPFN